MPNSQTQPTVAADLAAVQQSVAVHEAVCAARYISIDEKLGTGNKRFDKIDQRFDAITAHFDKSLRIIGGVTAVNVGLTLLGPGVAAEFVKRLVGL